MTPNNPPYYAGPPPMRQPPPPGAGPINRPGTTVVGVLGVVLSALCGIAYLVVVLAKGKAMLNGILTDIVHKELGDLGTGDNAGLVQQALNDAYHTLTTRAYVITFGVVFCLLFALLAWGGRNWTRIAMIPFMLIAVGMWLVDITDIGPMPLHVLDAAGVILGILGIVILLLPPSGRYGKARKAARRA